MDPDPRDYRTNPRDHLAIEARRVELDHAADQRPRADDLNLSAAAAKQLGFDALKVGRAGNRTTTDLTFLWDEGLNDALEAAIARERDAADGKSADALRRAEAEAAQRFRDGFQTLWLKHFAAYAGARAARMRRDPLSRED